MKAHQKPFMVILFFILFVIQSFPLWAQWAKAVNGNIPTMAFKASKFTNGDDMYIARAKIGGGVHLGKTRHGWGKASIAYGDKEEWVTDFGQMVAQLGVKKHFPPRPTNGMAQFR